MIETFKAQRNRNYNITLDDGTIHPLTGVVEVKPRGNPGDMTATAYEFVTDFSRFVFRADEMKMVEYWEV